MKATKVKFIIPAFAILIAFLFLMAPIGAASHSISKDATTSTNYQPNPTLNTNATWNTYYSAWHNNPMEYAVNSTANATLPANLSTFYQNPITINPGDIQTTALKATPGVNWTNKADWHEFAGGIGNIGETSKGIYQRLSSSNITGVQTKYYLNISEANLPSSSAQYDYVNIIGSYEKPNINGAYLEISADNSSNPNSLTGIGIKNGTTNFNGITKETNFFASFPISKFMKNIPNGYITLQIWENMPESATTGEYTSNVTIYGLSLTSAPLSLGTFTNSTGQHVVDALETGQTMNTFSPNFAWTSINNNGYSVAVSQPLQNVTQTQTPITSGNYIEQVGYQGSFLLPSAPGLSYGPANVTVNLTVPASQFQVLDINGASYLSTLGNKTNGTVALLTSTNPTTQISYLAFVDYTASQWQSISHPAGIFTYDGIAYYYWLAIGAIASLLGLGVGVRHANTKREQTEKVDRITRRGR